MSKKRKTNSGKAPMEFPSRREKNNDSEIDEVVCRETFNSNHQSGVKIDNITEVITAEADLQN
jgi:hypothetical protein